MSRTPTGKSGLQIAPSDIKYKSASISGVSKVSVEIAEQLYKQLTVSANYPSVQLTDIKKNYGILFKLLNDVSNVIDASLISVQKAVVETVNVSDDVILLNTQKAAREVVATFDAYNIQLSKQFADSNTAVDYVTVQLAKTFKEILGVTDQLSKSFGKGVSESISFLEHVVVAMGHFRKFEDFVAVDDLSSIDKFYDATKHNVAGVSDQALWEFAKTSADSVSTSDLPSWVFDKGINEALAANDSVTFDTGILFRDAITLLDDLNIRKGRDLDRSDTTGTSDSQAFDVLKRVLDNINMDDSLVLSSGSNMGDQASSLDNALMDISKSLVDSTGVSSYNRIHVLTKLSESFSTDDSLIITVVRGGSSMFNASLFNQTTFG